EYQSRGVFPWELVGGGGNDDIWVTRRETTRHPWDAPSPVAELNTAERENTPAGSLDGRTMVFSRPRGGLVEEDVFVSIRRDRMSPWSVPAPVSEVNTMTRDVC